MRININFTFFSFHNVYMFFNVIETNSYCAAYFLFFTKNIESSVCVIFLFEKIYIIVILRQ